MIRDEIDINKMIELFNNIAMREGFKIIVNEIDPLQFFSTKEQFYKMVDRLEYVCLHYVTYYDKYNITASPTNRLSSYPFLYSIPYLLYHLYLLHDEAL